MNQYLNLNLGSYRIHNLNLCSFNREKDLMALGASIQNILLAAVALGLGACWLGEILNRKEEINRLLRWDRDLEMVAALAVGYPGKKPGKGRRRPLRQLLLPMGPQQV